MLLTGRLVHNGTMYTTLIDVPSLQRLIASGSPVAIFDCSFDLHDASAGQRQFDEIHIAGSQYADLDVLLSEKNPVSPRSSGGRHPLPAREAFARQMAMRGLDDHTQVVVYDRQGANYCGRLWWMLKWSGHSRVAVLDGGLKAWQAAGLPTSNRSRPVREPVKGDFSVRSPLAPVVDAAGIRAVLGRPDVAIIDARAATRFRGETEPLDPVAGHLPGALNRPFADNLDAQGLFKPPERLREEFAALLGHRTGSTVIHHCGSGVSAIPNLLAMAVAGWGMTTLFPGSWSEWCATPDAVFARG